MSMLRFFEKILEYWSMCYYYLFLLIINYELYIYMYFLKVCECDGKEGV